MAVFKIARYEVRSDARLEAERAMHEHAAYVRRELPDAAWTTYRDSHAPTHYISLLRVDDRKADAGYQRAPGTEAFVGALDRLQVGALEVTEYELVTSSDLARRRR